MRNIQTCGQCNSHSNAGSAGTANQSLTDGIQNNEARVTENRDRNNPTHQLDGQLGILLTNQFNNHISQFECSTCLLQNRADQSTQNNNDTNRRECAGETSTDDIRDFTQRDACQQRQNQRNTHNREERMNLILGDCNDHCNDCQDEYNN